MARKLIWVTEKTHGAGDKRGACSECAWVPELRKVVPVGAPALHRKSFEMNLESMTARTFLEEFGGGDLSQRNVGRQPDNRDSVHGSMKVV
jgi:hypothetical protein